MPVTIFSKERLSQEEGVRAQRKEQLRKLMIDLNILAVNTGKISKAEAIADLINALTGQILVPKEVICFSDPNQEPFATRAVDVANSKVNNLIKDLESHPEHCRTIDGKDPDLDLLLSQFILFAGSDVNAFIQKPDGSWHQNHKLIRQYPEGMPDERFWQVREQLHQEFCFPASGRVVLRWDMASYLLNGRGHIFSDLIEIVSYPVDPELLDQYLLEALNNGLLLTSNQHFAALECLIESGKIISTSHLPRELEEQGLNLADFASFDVSPTVLLAFLDSVINNTPVYIP